MTIHSSRFKFLAIALILVAVSLLRGNLELTGRRLESDMGFNEIAKLATSAFVTTVQCDHAQMTTDVNSACSCLSQWGANRTTTLARALWERFEPTIRQAARDSLNDCWSWEGALDPLDEGNFTKLTRNMFTALSSYRMTKSVKTRANPLVMERVLEVLLRRMKYPKTNPPLRIAVFGGSVSAGCSCARNSFGLHPLMYRCIERCTWSSKLERLLNTVLGNGTVVVKNYAIGGTDSSVGRDILEYDMFADGEYTSSDFDIFISAYSSNDGRTPGATRTMLYEAKQQFIQLLMDQRPCSDLPLVIQLEDTMLDTFHQDNVRSANSYMMEMAETANWANIMSISYADAVRDTVYNDPSDETLTEYGEVHPGLAFTTAVAWVMAYNLLHGLMDACDAKTMPEHDSPEPRAGFSKPLLHDQLLSHDVASQWKKISEHKTQM